MRKMKYQMTFQFVKDENEAIRICDMENKSGSYYKRKRYIAHYTPWTASDGSFDGFVCIYWY